MTAEPDLDLVFPDWNIPDLPPPVLTNDEYVLFVADNVRLLRENQLWDKVVEGRPRPAEVAFVLE
jgi:hypothetical protein